MRQTLLLHDFSEGLRKSQHPHGEIPGIVVKSGENIRLLRKVDVLSEVRKRILSGNGEENAEAQFHGIDKGR